MAQQKNGIGKEDAETDGGAAAGEILQQPAEGDPQVIDRELARDDEAVVKKDEVAPEAGL